MFSPSVLKFYRLLMPAMTWSVPDGENVYLTFDDGPTPRITEWILATLAREDVRATFFCLGRNLEQHPHLHRMILDGGHRIGNHTYSHMKGWSVPTEQYVDDVEVAARIAPSELFRPPYGRITRGQARRLGERFRLVMGDVVSCDYDPAISPERCLGNVTRFVRGGSIVVFHDSLKSFDNMSYALPRTIDHIRAMGLGFKTL